MADPNIYDDQKYTSFKYDDTIASHDCIALATPRASMSLALTLLVAFATADIPAAAPATATGTLVEIVHGRPIADPYRWLEQLGDPVVQSWARAQSDSTRAVLGPAASGSTVGAVPPLTREITIEASRYRRLPSGKATRVRRIPAGCRVDPARASPCGIHRYVHGMTDVGCVGMRAADSARMDHGFAVVYGARDQPYRRI